MAISSVALELALAVVHDVNIVEVADIEGFCCFVCCVVEQIIDFRLRIVDKGTEEAAIAITRIEDLALTDSRGV